MGLFGGKKTYVASTVYNMAGEEAERVDFLKTIVISSVIGSRNFSISDTLDQNYLSGPGIKGRSFHRWALNNYQNIGVPTLNLNSSSNIDLLSIATYIPKDPDQIVEVTYAQINRAEASYWAEQWIMLNRPNDISLEWYSAYSDITGNITIFWPDTTTDVFTPADFDPEARYVFVVYALKTANSFLGSRLFIYRIGSGIGYLDDLDEVSSDSGTVLPYLPLRLNNKFLSSTYQPAAYELVKKAYTKATGKRGSKGLDDLISKINENESLEDIDHAYMVQAVTLNAKDNSARKYLFKFFDFLRTAQSYSAGSMDAYNASQASYETTIGAFNATREALDPVALGGPTDPATTGTIPVAPVPPVTTIRVKNSGPFDTKLEQTITWKTIIKTVGSGLKKPDAKVGELWWGNTSVSSTNTSILFVNSAQASNTDRSTVYLNWQKSADSWEQLRITGLVYENLIYKGNSVEIKASEALLDTDESGFLVPIHYDTLKNMSLVDSTQLMTVSNFLVFNSYEVVKQKWYETLIFKIIVFIVLIAITVITMGAAAPGLLGYAGAVGAALGFSGLAAAIVGAVANAIAAMILVAIINKVAVAAFGPKIGAIIAVVASLIAMNVGTALSTGSSMAAMWGNMMSAQNIMQLTSAVSSGVGAYMKASAMQTIEQMNEMMAGFEEEAQKINDMYLKEFGRSDFHFDPTNFTDVNMGGLTESPSMFLDRTLMTGSDIAEMSIDMLHGFVDATIDVSTIGR